MLKAELEPDLRQPGFYILRQSQSKHIDPTSHRAGVRSHMWRPPTDVYETADAVIVRVEIAGMDETGFTIVLDGRNLHIRGSRPDVPERRAYHQMEIRFGDFASDVDLPSEVSVEQIEAMYGNGFLHIRLPKARPQQIKAD